MDGSFATALLSSNPFTATLAAFVAGVLTSFTPCIYPMIPITAGIIGGGTAGAAAAPRRRVVALTLTYAAGLALVYSTLGVIAGLTGTLFGTVSSNPWLYSAMANILFLAALMMLEVLPVPIPRRWIAGAASVGSGGRFGGAFAMGAMSGLVAAPCGAPVFAAILTWVAATRSGWLGFLYLFAFSVGMTALLVIIGLFSGVLASLPRAGAWMVWIKRLFAALLIGAAEYYLLRAGQLWI